MFTQHSRDAMTVMRKTHHFHLCNSEHYKVSKSKVFEKVIPAANFCISADDATKIVKIGGGLC